MTRRLTRTPDDKWVGGVCGGIGRYLDVDANLIRLATAILTILGFGSVLVAYVVAWLLMPKDGPHLYGPYPGQQPYGHPYGHAQGTRPYPGRPGGTPPPPPGP